MPDSPEDKPDIIFLLKEYASTRIELLKLTLIEQGTGIAAGAATGAVMAFMFLFALVFGSVALGLFLGSVFNSSALGFAIVTLIYLLLALIMLFSKKNVEKKLIDIMIKNIFQKKK